MTQTPTQPRPATRAAAPTFPIRAGEPVPPQTFAGIRTRLLLRHCKWDPQVEDVSTLAPFPLLMSRRVWAELCADAESLAAELLEAERELLHRPELHGALALPRVVRRAFADAARALGAPPVAVRVMRFDFHWTDQGWRISEVNSDVPGGFSEASELPRLLARHVAGAEPAGDPGAAWADALAQRVGDRGDVALLAAAGFMEDQQVVSYMGRLLAERGLVPRLADPTQLRWRASRALLNERQVGAVVRFYQAEWLAALPRRHRGCWLPLAAGGRTPVTNPIASVLTESKRLPLVWHRLSARMPTWRRLLPETRDPRDANWQRDGDDDGDGQGAWLLKTAFCNTGDTVSAASLTPERQWRWTRWHARLFPGQWIAQRRFNTLPVPTPGDGHDDDEPPIPMYPCIGIYTIDGRACGAYARLSHRPIVDYRAVDAALLIERDEGDPS